MNLFDFRDAVTKLTTKNKSGKNEVVFLDRDNHTIYEITGYLAYDKNTKSNIVGISLKD